MIEFIAKKGVIAFFVAVIVFIVWLKVFHLNDNDDDYFHFQ